MFEATSFTLIMFVVAAFVLCLVLTAVMSRD